MIIRPSVARVFVPLLNPNKRYYGAHGGRGSGKSHFFAEQVVLRFINGERWVCIREVQRTIKDSVKQIIEDKIRKFGLAGQVEIVESELRHVPTGGLITFRGMQSYNADNIKSLEDFDGAWIEEGQTLSQHSLDLLRPTLRKRSSKIFCSWNPRFKTDAVDKFFRGSKRDDLVCVEANWYDNPWFDDTALRADMEEDYRTDQDKAEHIWGGAYGVLEGSILGRHVSQARRDGRINDDVTYDRHGSPIIISSDIGFHDTASWWYWQPTVGGVDLLKYEGESGYDADDWIPRVAQNIKDLGAEHNLGKIWLPHDAKAVTFQTKHTTIERFIKHFTAAKMGIVKQSSKADRIEAARTVIKRCAFNKEMCEDGLDGLEAWEFDYNHETQAFSREPKHNWASHPSDAFSYGCQVMIHAKKAQRDPEPVFDHEASGGHIKSNVTFEQMVRMTPKRRQARY